MSENSSPKNNDSIKLIILSNYLGNQLLDLKLEKS